MPRAIPAVLAVAALLAAAPAAAAATLATSTRCYQETQDVILNGSGFVPGTIDIARDGNPFGTAEADVSGAFQVKFPAEELARGVVERLHELTATDASFSRTATRFRTTKIYADFSPRRGDPRKLKVRFKINGFGLRRRRPSVYVHYVNPEGKSVRTVRLGTARGTCGKISRTRKRRLFPFPEPRRGRWIMQFDTNKRYTRATSKSRYIWVRKPVEIFRR